MHNLIKLKSQHLPKCKCFAFVWTLPGMANILQLRKTITKCLIFFPASRFIYAFYSSLFRFNSPSSLRRIKECRNPGLCKQIHDILFDFPLEIALQFVLVAFCGFRLWRQSDLNCVIIRLWSPSLPECRYSSDSILVSVFIQAVSMPRSERFDLANG